MERNLIKGNVPRDAAVGQSDTGVKDDPNLPRKQAGKNDRRDAL
jgi:hypothetical protein